jgi:hypothetical protein
MLIIGFWYFVRVLYLSEFFKIKIKVGSQIDFFIRYFFYIILLLFSIKIYLNNKNKINLIFLILSFIYLVVFFLGRYLGLFLTFEEFVKV